VANAWARERNEELSRALASNREIAVATGIVMSTLRSRAGRLSLLRIASQHTGRRVADPASEVIAKGELVLPRAAMKTAAQRLVPQHRVHRVSTARDTEAVRARSSAGGKRPRTTRAEAPGAGKGGAFRKRRDPCTRHARPGAAKTRGSALSGQAATAGGNAARRTRGGRGGGLLLLGWSAERNRRSRASAAEGVRVCRVGGLSWPGCR